MWRHLGHGFFYAIAYITPTAETGCHKVAVKAHRPHAAVFARDGYCRTSDPASDVLNGSKFEEKVQHDLASSTEAKISLSLQATVFFTNTGAARVDLSLEFPWNRLKHEWDDEGKFYATVGVLGMINRSDGTVASRFSDLACCSSEGSYSIMGNRSSFIIGNTDPSAFDKVEPIFDSAILPARYETQLDLPAGEYDLQVVLSDGSKYGRVERPLTIEPYDGTQIGLSSIALCKRVRYASAGIPEAAAADLAPKYVPLVSKGLEFTPAGDTTFGGQDPFFAYYEIYDPLVASAPGTTVQTRTRIINTTTGAVESDTGLRSAADWMEAGKTVIRVSEQIAGAKLARGSYRIEAQASDSAGRSSPWRTANFTVRSPRAQPSPNYSARANQSQQRTAPTTTTQTPPATGQVKTNTADVAVIPLRSRADLIPVRVVVRDGNGGAVANLRKEDFRVFEDRKQQDISYFSVETPNTLSLIPETADSAGGKTVDATVQKNESSDPAASSLPPAHFVALLFDDVHIAVEDLSRTRDAAIRFVDASLGPTDRVAVLTISGRSELDFTANRETLHSALLGLRQRTMGNAATPGTRECPSIDYYQADRIVNRHDQEATNVAVYEALACAFGDDPVALSEARTLAMSAAQRVNGAGEMQTRESFRRLEEVVQSISSRPGQRSLVLLSPGFICPDNQYELADIIDRANRMNIFINTLDARGLYTSDLGDAGLAKVDSQCGLPCVGGWFASRVRVRTAGQSAQSQVLDALAEGTGGLDSHSNDLAGGLLRLASLPETSYLIAFTPHNLKYDGKFHSLKVTLSTKQRVTIQARRGFYDPKQN